MITLAARMTLRREPVGRDPADQGEHQRRRDLRREHERQVRGRPGGVEHRERNPDHREPDRRRGDQPLGEQDPEVPDRQYGEPADEATTP
jgi:hypothetical protein